MAASPPAPAPWPQGIRNLFEAKKLIRKLQSQLGTAKPVPKVDPMPTGGSKPIVPLPLRPEKPETVPPGGHDLGNLAPKAFSDFLQNTTTKDLHVLLARETAKGRKEQNPDLVKKLYKEIKRR